MSFPFPVQVVGNEGDVGVRHVGERFEICRNRFFIGSARYSLSSPKGGESWGEEVTAFVVPAGSPPSAEDLIAYAQERLAKFKCPRAVRLAMLLWPNGTARSSIYLPEPWSPPAAYADEPRCSIGVPT